MRSSCDGRPWHCHRRYRSGVIVFSSMAILIGGACSSAFGAGGVRFRGVLEVSALAHDTRALALNVYNRGDSPFDLARFRFFVDAAPTPRLQILTQLRFDDALPDGFTLAGAYLLYELVSKGKLYVEVGKIPSPFGTFSERDYAEKSALIGTPLMYYFHSSLLSHVVPANEDELLSVRGQASSE